MSVPVRPLNTIAAISVILFSGVGIATLMGWIPESHSKVNDTAAALPLTAPNASGSAASPASGPSYTQPAQAQAMLAAPPGTPVSGMPPPPAAQPMLPAGLVPPPGSAPVAMAPGANCANCGTVREVREVEVKGEATGLGAIAGGLLGAVVGHQVGRGNGNTVATIAGAGGGALAGNAVEQNVRKKVSWQVTVAMSNGSLRTFHFDHAPHYAVGDAVTLNHGHLAAN